MRLRVWMRLVVVLGLVGGLLGVGAGGAGGVVGVVDAPAAPRACLDVPERGFVDVADSNVHKDAIDCVAFYGITIGCGSGEGFCPEQRVPRWQVALFLARVAELPGVFLGPGLDDGAGFDDLGEALPADAVAAVNRLSSEGVIKGRSETRFDPYGLITRGQMALLLVRFFETGPLIGGAGGHRRSGEHQRRRSRRFLSRCGPGAAQRVRPGHRRLV